MAGKTEFLLSRLNLCPENTCWMCDSVRQFMRAFETQQEPEMNEPKFVIVQNDWGYVASVQAVFDMDEGTSLAVAAISPDRDDAFIWSEQNRAEMDCVELAWNHRGNRFDVCELQTGRKVASLCFA